MTRNKFNKFVIYWLKSGYTLFSCENLVEVKKMAESRRRLSVLAGMLVAFVLVMSADMTVQAGSNYLESLNGGVAAILEPGTKDSSRIINATAKKLNLTLEAEVAEEESDLVMVNVKKSLNVRSEASADADKVGKIYKDCGGTILERKDGWTKIQSGNLIGWALAEDVGRLTATVNTETLRVRTEESQDAEVLGLLPAGEIVEALSQEENGWICIDFEGQDGYVAAEYVVLDFQIDAGETLEEIKARQKAEREAKRHQNYGEYTTDADTTMLLAALIHCEAGGESYEGQVAVGAVVMNRVRSSAYPDTIHGVIYASGQFTPAQSGKLNRVYESGKIYSSCIKAAEEALAGVSNVGDLTHFRRNNGREGLVIGNHVFY